MAYLKITGSGSFKYMAAYWLWTIVVYAAWFISVFLPYGEKFLNLLQTQMNEQKWELLKLLTPIFYIIGYWFICQVLIIVIAIVLFKIWKEKYL